MIYIRQNTPFVLVWEIELQGAAIKLEDTDVSVIASCARGKIDLTDYIDSLEENTITINQNKGLAFIGDYSLMAIIKSENLTTLKVQEKYVFRTIAKNDPTETESLVSIRSSIVASGGYDSALSDVSQNAIQNAPVAKEFAKVREEIADASRQAIEEVLGGASEAYDTLLEIEKYIEKDEAGAVALAQSIARLETEKVSTEDIDSALSTESENPVQNKVVTEELNKKVEKSEHDALAQSVENNKTATDEAINVLQEELNKKATSEALDALSGSVVSLKVKKADKDGNYPSLHVGTADDLAGRGESVPAEFGFRASGGKSIKDGRAYIKRIKGNSVVWNNQSENSLSQDSPTQSLPIGSKLVQGHKYLMLAESITNCALFLYYNIDGSNIKKRFENTYSFFTSDASISANGLISGQGALWWYVLVQDSTVEYSANKVRLIDLTQMFGAGNEPTTIEEFNARKPIVEDEYAYNEGEVIHCNTESIKSVGDNAWDEEWEVLGTNAIISKNFNRCIGGETYHVRINNADYEGNRYWLAVRWFDKNKNQIQEEYCNNKSVVCPSNACYFKILTNTSTYLYGNTYNNDIMITLVHSGWKQDTDAGYQPYWQDTLPLPIIRKYFPQGMKKAGTAHDEIRFNKASGKWEAVQRIGSVDMGKLSWNYGQPSDNYPYGYFYKNINDKEYGNNLLCAKYTFALSVSPYSIDKNIFGANGNKVVYIIDSAYTDAAVLKADLQGVMLYYELAEPIVTELDAEDQNFRDYYQVADFGTEMSQSSVPSAAFSADIIYQFNAVDMIREHEIEITELQKVIATMQAQLTSLINGGQ